MRLAALSDDALWAVVDPLMDSLMEASTEIDHARHTRDFTDRLKAIVTPEHFDDVCRRYQAKWGRFTRREPVALFRRGDSVAVVWRQFLDETEDEFVAEMVVVERDGDLKIDHVVFF